MKNTDRRVSIKQNQPIFVEYLSEKRSNTSGQSVQPTNGGTLHARPASLVLIKGDRPTYRLVRTPSIDQEQDDATVINTVNFICTDSCTNQRNIPTMNSNHHMIAAEMNTKYEDDEDESAPLVQSLCNESSKIEHGSNHS